MEPELMRALQQIRDGQIRAEERAVADRAFQSRMLDTLDGLRGDMQEWISVAAARANPAPVVTIDQGVLIRWLALAVVLASLGSKALELIPLLGKG